jgi:hypothetical protein
MLYDEDIIKKNQELSLLWDSEFKEQCEPFNSYIDKSNFDFDFGLDFRKPNISYPSDHISVSIWINNKLLNGESLPDIFPYYQIDGRIDATGTKLVYYFGKRKWNGQIDYAADEYFDDLDSLLVAMKSYLINLKNLT